MLQLQSWSSDDWWRWKTSSKLENYLQIMHCKLIDWIRISEQLRNNYSGIQLSSPRLVCYPMLAYLLTHVNLFSTRGASLNGGSKKRCTLILAWHTVWYRKGNVAQSLMLQHMPTLWAELGENGNRFNTRGRVNKLLEILHRTSSVSRFWTTNFLVKLMWTIPTSHILIILFNIQ